MEYVPIYSVGIDDLGNLRHRKSHSSRQIVRVFRFIAHRDDFSRYKQVVLGLLTI